MCAGLDQGLLVGLEIRLFQDQGLNYETPDLMVLP